MQILFVVFRVGRIGNKELGQRGEDFGPDAPEFLPVDFRELVKKAFAPPLQHHQNLTVVRRVAAAPDQAELRRAVRELHNGVMTKLELPRQRSDRRGGTGREPLHGEEELVLAGLQPGGAGGLLAEDQESPGQVAEAGKSLVQAGRDFADGVGHSGRIS